MGVVCLTNVVRWKFDSLVGGLQISKFAVEMDIPEHDFAIEIGEDGLTECETVNLFKGPLPELPRFARGYGLVVGQPRQKSIAIEVLNRALHNMEFARGLVDDIQAAGILKYPTLPHCADFRP